MPASVKVNKKSKVKPAVQNLDRKLHLKMDVLSCYVVDTWLLIAVQVSVLMIVWQI